MAILKKTTKKEAAQDKEQTPVVAEEKTAKAPASTNTTVLKPHVSEKAALAEQRGTYTFLVDMNATKVDIKQAVKAQYGVTPKKVRIVINEGKRLRRGRTMGKRSDFKKAMVTLSAGQSISIHQGV